MIFPEQQSNSFLPPSYYLDTYRAGISRLDDLENCGAYQETFNLDEIGIYPKKLTAAVMLVGKRDIDILVDIHPEGGYDSGDHKLIAMQHGILDHGDNLWGALLIQATDDRWVLVCGGITMLSTSDKTRFQRMLLQYNIS